MSDDRIARLHDDGLPADVADRLDARLAALPLDIEPPAPGFADVEERLAARGLTAGVPQRWRATRTARTMAVAASVAVIAFVATLQLGPSRDAGRDGTVASLPDGTAAVPAPVDDEALRTASTLAGRDAFRTAALPGALGGRAALGAGFLQVRESQAQDFATALTELDPATREVVETNLLVIHQAMSRIETALASEPDNRVLRELLMSTYRQELDYMGRVVRMPRPGEGSIEL